MQPEKTRTLIPLIVGVVTSDNFEEIVNGKGASESASFCSVWEFRADTFPLPLVMDNLRKIRRHMSLNREEKKALLFTVRLERDGGSWSSSPESRKSLLSEVLREKLTDWVDIELEEIENFSSDFRLLIRKNVVKLMISHHNFKKSYSEKEFLNYTDAMSLFSPDIVKIAVTVRSRREFVDLLGFSVNLRKQFPQSCLISMGRFGPQSRIASPLIGAPITYGSLGGREPVKGLMDAGEIYRGLNEMQKAGAGDLSPSQLVTFFDREKDDR